MSASNCPASPVRAVRSVKSVNPVSDPDEERPAYGGPPCQQLWPTPSGVVTTARWIRR